MELSKLLAIGLFLIAAGCVSTPDVTPCEPKVTGRYIIFNRRDFKAPVNTGIQFRTLNSMVSILGAKNGKSMEGINGVVLEFPEKSNAPQLTKELKDAGWELQPEYIHHTFQGASCQRVETIPCPGQQAPAPAPTEPRPPCPGTPPPADPAPVPTPQPPQEQAKSWGVTRVRAMEAKAKVSTSNVRVGIVDTGLDLQHECLGTVVATKSFTGEAVSPDPGQHGTHVAGTVAGKCGVGVSQAGIVFGKGLMNNGSGSSSQLAQAVNWVCSQSIKVASFSWGSSQSDPLINQAIEECTRKGIAVAIANGNDSRGTLNWPAALSKTNPLVFGVAASDRQDKKASFSTYGTGTKFIAPGVDIISNKPGGGFQPMSGTSMATPHVAGALAFCAALNKPFQSCMKTDDLGLGVNTQGAGMPRPDLL